MGQWLPILTLCCTLLLLGLRVGLDDSVQIHNHRHHTWTLALNVPTDYMFR